jgi:anaerobic selenocysteine-containing dehydrogenase
VAGRGGREASIYTYGASVPGAYIPDLDNAGCILYWGYNLSVAQLAHATSTVAALARGARLVVVDPRRGGLAAKAHHWRRVRPGTDAALVLSLTHVMIENGWFDRDFVRRWTNAPLLLRADTGEDVFTAALEGRPYRVRGLVNFGANLLIAHGDSVRGRDALAALDFFVHADLFMNPTAEQADLVLPVASAFEAEGLRIGFEISEAAQSLVQLRRPLVPPRGEARSDLQIIFGLATRLALGEHLWDGDLEAAFRHQLAPSGVTLEQLRAEPGGVRVPLTTRHH